jgi:hypothetical protein
MTTGGEGTPDELEIHRAARPLGVRILALRHLSATYAIPFFEQVVNGALRGDFLALCPRFAIREHDNDLRRSGFRLLDVQLG